MATRLPTIDKDGEVSDLSLVDAALFKPAAEALPPDLYAELIAMNKKRRGERGSQIAPTKKATTLRLDADVLEAFKSEGKGWQTRMNNALREWLASHPSA